MSNLGSTLATGTGFLAAASLPLWVPIGKRRRRRDIQDEEEEARFREFYDEHLLRVKKF